MSDLADLIRRQVPEMSNREIARRADVRPGTVDRIMNGIGHPKVETVDKIAHALGIPVERAREAAGKPRGTARPYTPPAEANLLDERQRRAIDELIRAFVTTEGQTDDTDQTPQQEPRTEARRPQHRGAGEAPREGAMTAADDPTAPPPLHLADAARSGESEAERRRHEDGDDPTDDRI